MKNNYDNIAGFYDFLSRLVFFKTQIKAQISVLKHIPPASKILIVGGGSGWILEELSTLYPSGLSITYVEISAKMLRQSSNRNYKDNEVVFVQAAIEDCEGLAFFDVVITSFLFDNFLEEKAVKVFSLLNSHLHPSGRWLYTDFYVNPAKSGVWKKWLLTVMYKFFNYICDVEASTLVNMERYFEAERYQEITHSSYYFGFIKSIVYKKITKGALL